MLSSNITANKFAQIIFSLVLIRNKNACIETTPPQGGRRRKRQLGPPHRKGIFGDILAGRKQQVHRSR